MAQEPTEDNALVSFYSERITEPATDDEVYGYWLFVVGIVAALVGVLLFLYSTTVSRPPAAQGGGYWLVREAAIVLGGAGAALMLGGVAIRLPLERAATYLTYVGVVVCLVAMAWFVVVYPASGWPTDTGHTGVIGLYTLGLALIGISSVIVPMLSRADIETDSEQAARERREAEDAAEREELERTRAERESALAELDALRASQARFEMYVDRGGGHRWRLRHRNGNIIADSGEGYASRQKCQQGLASVRRNALGAELLRIEPDDPEAVAEETETEPIEYESQATFEVYADDAGGHRWRLVHDNGNVLADSAEGYASRRNVDDAVDRAREYTGEAPYLRIDPTGFEVYRDRAGDYRWRLVHENGNILADSGEGYASRQKCRQGLDSVRNNAGGAGIGDEEGDSRANFDVYADDAGDHRWRLVHDNGNIIADSGEGYADRRGAREAAERVAEYAPAGDVLDFERAAFEIYEDAGGEWRWRLRHRNGNIIADSGEGYADRSNCTEAIDSLKRNAPGAETAEG